jgi:hypothetical protein
MTVEGASRYARKAKLQKNEAQWKRIREDHFSSEEGQQGSGEAGGDAGIGRKVTSSLVGGRTS